MDMAVPTGTPIRAALPGTVTVSKYNAGGYGYYVMIDHGSGLATLYGHCSSLLVQAGQTVEAGDIIALSGSTGRFKNYKSRRRASAAGFMLRAVFFAGSSCSFTAQGRPSLSGGALCGSFVYFA